MQKGKQKYFTQVCFSCKVYISVKYILNHELKKENTDNRKEFKDRKIKTTLTPQHKQSTSKMGGKTSDTKNAWAPATRLASCRSLHKEKKSNQILK